MKLFAFSGIALSLGLFASVSFAQDYSSRANSAYQRTQANSHNVPGSRYRSARSARSERTAFRMNLQEATGSEVDDALPSPSDAAHQAKPDREIIGTSPAKPTVSSVVSHGNSHGQSGACQSAGYAGHSYVDYGAFGSANCAGQGGSGSGFMSSLCSGFGLFDRSSACDGGGNCGLSGGELLGKHIGCGGWNDGAGFCGALGGFGAGGCWYGGVYGLFLSRDDDYGQSLGYDTATPAIATLATNQGYDDYFGGFEARIGRNLCGAWSLEGAYWGIYPDVEQFNVRRANLGGDLRTTLGYNNLAYNNGALVAPVSQYYGDATRTSQAHRLRRSYEIHNAEINFVNAPCVSCSKFSYSFLAGVRYFKFDDGLTFSSDYGNQVWGDDLANELHYDVEIDNNLIGFQLGNRMNYRLINCLSLNAGANFGVYNNHMSQVQRIRGGNGFAYDVNSGQDYYVQSSDDDLALLGDISVGLAYDVCCNWRLTGGYRVTAASGIANATSQIPRGRDFSYYDRVRHIDSHDTLVLHGAFFGVEHTW